MFEHTTIEPGNGFHQNSRAFQAGDSWPDPIPMGAVSTPDIPPDLLPGWLGDYVQAVSESTQTPAAMAIMIGLSTVATCLQGKFEVSPFSSDYREPLSLWTLTAMPPASRKSAVVSAMTGPLLEWEKEQAESLKDEIAKRATTRKVTQKRIDKLELDASKKDDPAERGEIVREITRLRADMPDELRAPRLWTGDVTPERLQGLLVEQSERMAVLSDEGGIFEILAGLYSDGRANIDVFLQAHAGNAVRVDRADRQAYLNRPALTLGLAVQPQILNDMGSGGKRRFRGLGALARFLYAVPTSNIGKRNVREHKPVPEMVKQSYRAGLFQLLAIGPSPTVDRQNQPFTLMLSPDALDVFRAFCEFIERNQGPGGEFEPIQDWTGKLPGAVLRIAGLFHVIRYGLGCLEIGIVDIQAAQDLAEKLIPHAQVALARTGEDPAAEDARKVLEWIIAHGESKFTRGECHKALHGRFKTIERLTSALEMLQNHNYLGGPVQLRMGKGRPPIAYEVNPKIFREGGGYGMA